MNETIPDIGLRAVKTFIQTAIPALGLVAFTDIDFAVLEAAALSGAAAAVSVLMNALLNWANTD